MKSKATDLSRVPESKPVRMAAVSIARVGVPLKGAQPDPMAPSTR